MSGEEVLEEGRGLGPKDSTWVEVERSIVFKEHDWNQALPGAKFANRLLFTHAPPSVEGYDCRDMIASGYQIAPGESLLFTIGRAPEACNEIPFIMQKHGGILSAKDPIPDLFDYNVEAIWYTGRYMIMNIKAVYELGGSREGLAFWDLHAGWIRSVVAQTQMGDQGLLPPAPTEGLAFYLRDLARLRVQETNEVVYVDLGNTKLVFWPAKQEWMVLP